MSLIKTLRYHLKHLATTLVLFIVILEISMRAIAWMLMRPSDRANRISPQDAQSFRILTLGESTTADFFADGKEASWPRVLEGKMADRYGEGSVRVFNGGVSAITTPGLMANLERQIEEFKPHLVVAMAGINDNVYMEYGFDSPSHWGLFFHEMKIAKLFRWIGENLRYSRRKHGRRGSYTVEYPDQPSEKWDMFNAFWKDFQNDVDSGNIEEVLRRAENILSKQQHDRYMTIQTMRTLFNLYVLPNDLSDKSKTIIENFLARWADRILSEIPNFVEILKMKAEIYINSGHPKCMSTAIEILKFYPLAPDDETTAFHGLASCQKNPKINLDGLETVQSYLSDKNLSLDTKKEPFLSTQKNMKEIYGYLKKKNIDIIFMQYPLADIDILQYILSTDHIIKIKHGRYRDAIISRWQPPPFEIDGRIKFLENKKNFKEALEAHDFDKLFIDRFGVIFGHTSTLGHELIADNVMDFLERQKIYPLSSQSRQ